MPCCVICKVRSRPSPAANAAAVPCMKRPTPHKHAIHEPHAGPCLLHQYSAQAEAPALASVAAALARLLASARSLT
jgi:hypothetical protein